MHILCLGGGPCYAHQYRHNQSNLHQFSVVDEIVEMHGVNQQFSCVNSPLVLTFTHTSTTWGGNEHVIHNRQRLSHLLGCSWPVNTIQCWACDAVRVYLTLIVNTHRPTPLLIPRSPLNKMVTIEWPKSRE